VEGAFDILAARLVCPDVPILSSLTKMLGKHHLAYLTMLGVNQLVLMFDNEEAKGDRSMGAGNMSMAQQAATIKTMQVTTIDCPASDPSEALKDPEKTKRLAAKIRSNCRY
jgi:hypothetical protein